MKTRALKSALLGAGVFCGCTALSPTVGVVLKLPPLPDAFKERLQNGADSRCLILYENGSSSICKKEISYTQTASLEIFKRENSPVLFYPPFSLRPYGGFFTGETVLQLTWKGGFLVETIYKTDAALRKNWNPQPLLERINEPGQSTATVSRKNRFTPLFWKRFLPAFGSTAGRMKK